MNQIFSKAKFHIELATTYGIPQPRARVALPKGTPYRHLNAVLHALAAKIELATPAGESWCVELAQVGGAHAAVQLARGRQQRLAVTQPAVQSL